MSEPKKGIELIFPTPLYYSYVEGEKLNEVQKEILNVYNKIEWKSPPDWNDTHDLSTDNFETDDIEKYDMVAFRKMLHEELEIYCEYLNYEIKKYRIESWFTKFKPGDFAHNHLHMPAHISGCYYLLTNGDDGDIYFENPNSCVTSTLCYRKTASRWTHKPEVGKLLLFPSWLRHGVFKNNTNSDRSSFSFNIFFKD
jgi:uncharacterized protein (TIGR02466 family)